MSNDDRSKKELVETLVPEFLDVSIEEDTNDFDEDVIQIVGVDDGDRYMVELPAEGTDLPVDMVDVEAQTAIETVVRSAMEEKL